MSLRRRLIAIVLLCLVVSCGAVALTTTLALRGFLIDRLDQQLSEAGGRFAVLLEHPSDRDHDDQQFQSVAGQQAGTLGARVANGAVSAFGVVGVPNAVADSAAQQTLAHLRPSSAARTITLHGFGEYRVLVSSGVDGDLLVTGLPEHSVDDTITRLLTIEAIVFGGALLVCGAGAAILVRLSLRPLSRVTHTALAVSELPLTTGEVSLPERLSDPVHETEVGQVAEAFNRMLEHVESALNERQESEDKLRRFVADASHELRTPVAVVRAHAEFAKRGATVVPADVTHALDRIEAESDRMTVLIDELLLLARLDAGRPLEREQVDLTRMALDAVRDAQVSAPEHRWQLELPDEPVEVMGDQHALHQVLANLLSNARTHTPPGTTVTTQLHREPAAVLLTVADDGPGITPELREHVFERFTHGPGSVRAETGGSGLGLSIVSAIVTAHGGTVEARSDPGRTVFSVRLPVD